MNETLCNDIYKIIVMLFPEFCFSLDIAICFVEFKKSVIILNSFKLPEKCAEMSRIQELNDKFKRIWFEDSRTFADCLQFSAVF